MSIKQGLQNQPVQSKRQLIETHNFPFRVQLKSLSRKKRSLNSVAANPIADKTALQQNDGKQEAGRNLRSASNKLDCVHKHAASG